MQLYCYKQHDVTINNTPRKTATKQSQISNRSAYVTFLRTIPRGKFTLTSRDLFFYMRYFKVVVQISL